jgi:hypothetical protein
LYDKFVRQNLVPTPLFPFVLDVAREYFWDNLLTYVDNYVATLVRICNAHDTSGDVRGRLFELAVIKKSLVRDTRLYLDDGKVFELPNKYLQCAGGNLPDVTFDECALYIPKSQTFPTIHFLWKSEEYIIGVQVHTSRHHSVVARFESKCRAKGWTRTYKLYLLYLCPSADVKFDVLYDFYQIRKNSKVNFCPHSR